jgi:hypothetical protein
MSELAEGSFSSLRRKASGQPSTSQKNMLERKEKTLVPLPMRKKCKRWFPFAPPIHTAVTWRACSIS